MRLRALLFDAGNTLIRMDYDAIAPRLAASGVVLFHTHPSGDPAPSAEDLAFTRRLAQAGEIVGIQLVDHLILGTTERFVSLRERGAW